MPLESDALEPLLHTLPEVLVHSRADNTVRTYYQSFAMWDSWASAHQVSSLPAQPLSVALYILARIQLGHTYAVCKSGFYSIGYLHKLHMMPDPTSEMLPTLMLEAAKRLDKHCLTKKEPITNEILKMLHNNLMIKDGTLGAIRTMTFCILGYCGFLRYDEISNLQFGDFVFERTFMKIFIEKSKTDVYRDGKWVFIAKGDTQLCPIQIVNRYFRECGFTPDSGHEFIFRGISKGKFHEKLRSVNKPLSYTRVREVLLQALGSIGLEPRSFGTHSLRAGGATVAANAGVPDRLFKKHGRWKSEKAKDGYVKDNVSQLLRVSQSLGV